MGITDGLIRFSAGLEDAEDLFACNCLRRSLGMRVIYSCALHLSVTLMQRDRNLPEIKHGYDLPVQSDRKR